MTKAADIGSKRLISLAPNAWLQWITGLSAITAREFISSDFQWVSREGDVLIKAHHPDIGEFLVLNELQLRYDRRMPRRVRAYTALAEERYDLPTYPVVVNILPPAAAVEIPNSFHSELFGLQSKQDYQVINLWQVDVDMAFDTLLPTLLPFVPILQGGNNEAALKKAVRMLRADEQLKDLEPLLAFFGSFVLETRLIQQILRWDMLVLEESPWYRELIQKGLDRGLQQGLQQGTQRGQLEIVNRLLHQRLGNLDDRIQNRLQDLSIEQIGSLADVLFDLHTLEDLENWLEQTLILDSSQRNLNPMPSTLE